MVAEERGQFKYLFGGCYLSAIMHENHRMAVQGSAQQRFSNPLGQTNKAICKGRALPKNQNTGWKMTFYFVKITT